MDTPGYLALAVKPLDVATPLMYAAKIKEAQADTQSKDIQMRRDAIGAEARGLAPLVGTPEFDQAHQAAGQRLAQMGVLDTPQAQAGWQNQASTPLGIQSLIARSNPPQLAEEARHHKALETQSAAQLAQTSTLNAAQIENMKAQRTLQERQQTISENAPISVQPGTELINKKTGEAIYSNKDSTYKPEEITQLAKQLNAGDVSVLTNVGRGAQGAQDIRAIRKEAVRLNSEAGKTGAEQANTNAEFFGVKAGQRTLGTKQANIEMAATEFEQVLPIVEAASKAVSRTNYPDLNKIIMAFETKTGDPSVIKLGSGINTLINLYARATNPSGAITVDATKHAREILDKAWAQGQFDAATGMMRQEIAAAKGSPEKVREEMRARFLGGQAGAAKPDTAAASPAAVGSAPAPPPGFTLVK